MMAVFAMVIAGSERHGQPLLADALRRAVRSEIASFPDQPMKLFRPMADLAKLFA